MPECAHHRTDILWCQVTPNALSSSELWREGASSYIPTYNTLPDHCEIRDLAIEDSFYTYCANHPHRRPERDRIPIGPVTCHGGWKEDQPEVEYPRYVWKPSPDTEEVRQHLLSLLDSIFEHMLDDQYPIGNRLEDVVVWELREFREQRALRGLPS